MDRGIWVIPIFTGKALKRIIKRRYFGTKRQQQRTMTKLYIIWDYVSNMVKVLFSLIDGLITIFLRRQNLTIQKQRLN